MGEFMAGIFMCLLVFWGCIVSYFKHNEELARLKAKDVDLTPALIEELASMRRQISEVSERASQFDLSFDDQLARLERRIDGTGTPNVSSAPPGVRQMAEDGEVARVTVGGVGR